jgi:hypothetical protein
VKRDPRHAEIARRYARRAGGRGRVSMAALRIAELSRLFLDRYGPTLPDDDAGRADVRIVVHHIARLRGPSRRIAAWLETRAPWFTGQERLDLEDTAIANPLRWRADVLAVHLGLTAADRKRLRITTIGAIDQTKAERAEQRRRDKRDAAERRRRAKGAVPRQQWLAAHSASPQGPYPA